MGQIVDAIMSRRSIRKFKQQKVPREVIAAILEVGRSAPSRCNLQPWHFVVVDDEAGKQKLYDACFQQSLLLEAPLCIIVIGIIDPRGKLPKCTAELVEAGAITAQVKGFADHILDDWPLQEMKVDAALNAAIAATLMSVAALDFGLGSCWVKLARDDEVLAVVGAPDGCYHAGTLAFGYPAEAPNPRPRRRLEEVASLGRWGNPYG